MWTHFYDLHSGGDQKLDWQHIYIERPEDVAEVVFERLFNRDPYNVTCDCCGCDYSVTEHESLEEATEAERNSDGIVPRDVAVPLAEYINRPDVKVIFAHEITLMEDGK
jgi:hypothetical protein